MNKKRLAALRKKLPAATKKKLKFKVGALKTAILVKQPNKKKPVRINMMPNSSPIVVNVNLAQKHSEVKAAGSYRPVILTAKPPYQTVIVKNCPSRKTLVLVYPNGSRVAVLGLLKRKPKIVRVKASLETLIVGGSCRKSVKKTGKAKARPCSYHKKVCSKLNFKCLGKKSKQCNQLRRTCLAKAKKCKFAMLPRRVAVLIKRSVQKLPKPQRKKILKKMRKAALKAKKGVALVKRLYKVMPKKMVRRIKKKIVQKEKQIKEDILKKLPAYVKKYLKVVLTPLHVKLAFKTPLMKKQLSIAIPINARPKFVSLAKNGGPIFVSGGGPLTPVFVFYADGFELVVVKIADKVKKSVNVVAPNTRWVRVKGSKVLGHLSYTIKKGLGVKYISRTVTPKKKLVKAKPLKKQKKTVLVKKLLKTFGIRLSGKAAKKMMNQSKPQIMRRIKRIIVKKKKPKVSKVVLRKIAVTIGKIGTAKSPKKITKLVPKKKPAAAHSKDFSTAYKKLQAVIYSKKNRVDLKSIDGHVCTHETKFKMVKQVVFNPKKFVFCKYAKKAFKGLNVAKIFNKIDKVRQDLKAMLDLKKSFYSAVCDDTLQKFISERTQTIVFSNSFCSGLLSRFKDYLIWKNVVLTTYMQKIHNYLKCYSTDGSRSNQFPFPFISQRQVRIKKAVLACTGPKSSSQHQRCIRLCSSFSALKFSKIFDGDKRLFKGLYRYILSTIRLYGFRFRKSGPALQTAQSRVLELKTPSAHPEQPKTTK